MMSDERRARICVPVCARRADELRPFVSRAAEVADIVELRLDCLDEDQLDPSRPLAESLKNLLHDLLLNFRTPFIITFRPAEQGGHRALDTSARVDFWQSAAEELSREGFQARVFADIELDLFESPHGESLCDAAKSLSVICSHHDFRQTPADLASVYERMARTPARIIKIAARANVITDCLEVLRLLERARRDGGEMIAVAMGEAGLLTRVLAPSRGAFLTYGSLDSAQATAPGQTVARELRRLYRVHDITERTLVTGLVGSPVAHSLSPRIHNAAFAALGLDAVYIPFETADAADFLRRMARPRTRELSWNLRGLSVTAPHKTAVMPQLDWVEPKAAEIGAVNTVRIEGDELRGYNTDAEAAVKPLDGLIDLSGARVAVIGAGGAARALLWSLRERGARATVFARNGGRAREIANAFGADAVALNTNTNAYSANTNALGANTDALGASIDAPEGASFGGFDVVVNATPLGTRGER